MNLNKRLKEIERQELPQPKLKVFTQAVDGTITGEGLEFKNKAEYEKYAEKQGFNESRSVLFVEIVNAPI
ncbi:hypothetical protein [Gracilimonas mengyeensis]|uniref:Uncharacterized protein n=1 Tax=Gracilimonas mengyeensis TaxID=1302730 RepID=A0A521EM16_9BACT|nr:hypothetical protein [Gracilimonas mengyeensis]SMO84160.1 hypothetical protein SAMN06265219_11286 [Gracilimonas mengyeensis]